MKKTFEQRWASEAKQKELEANLQRWAEKRAQPGKASWLAAPVAYIEKPMRFLQRNLTHRYIDEEGKPQLRVSALLPIARELADAGDGEAVQKIAQYVLYNPHA